jgi:hypothetical protein
MSSAGRVGRRRRHMHSALFFPNPTAPPLSQPPTRIATAGHTGRTSRRQAIQEGIEEGWCHGVRIGRADGMRRRWSRWSRLGAIIDAHGGRPFFVPTAPPAIEMPLDPV